MADGELGTAEKKEMFLDVPGRSSPALSPVSTNQSRHRSQSQTCLSLHSTRSYVDGHGTYFTEPEHSSNLKGDEVDIENSQEKTFEVGWDGPDDPMNPKNMPTFKKWLVVVALAFGSLCVTCTSSLYTITYGKSIVLLQRPLVLTI